MHTVHEHLDGTEMLLFSAGWLADWRIQLEFDRLISPLTLSSWHSTLILPYEPL